MQNKPLSFIIALCLSTALISRASYAQEMPQDGTIPMPVPVEEQRINDAQAKPVVNQVKEAEKKALEVELSNTNVNTSDILDFPSRTTLGGLEMATLPGVNESMITGPSPMAPSVSTKDMPSEQLLGRITSEVFQEMAELERGNVFLKLQMQKEQLKNDLEKLKASYRQTRLEEIAKREDVVRSRINWWQEQENVRLEMEKKKAETEAVEQQIAEAEELRNKLRADAIENNGDGKAIVIEEDEDDETDGKRVRASEIYSLVSVKGVKNNLTATLMNSKDGKLISVKTNEVLPTGFIVNEITRDTIKVTLGNKTEVLLFSPTPAITAAY